jgi:hypothetical protein
LSGKVSGTRAILNLRGDATALRKDRSQVIAPDDFFGACGLVRTSICKVVVNSIPYALSIQLM